MLGYVGCVLLYVVIILSLLAIVHRQNHGRHYPRKTYVLYFFLFVLFGVYAYHTGDYAHYRDEIARLSANLLGETHMEMFYVFLVKLTNGNYTLWRLCVFAIMFYLLYVYLKAAKQDTFHALFWYALLILPSAVNGRAPIGILSFFISILFFIRGGRYYFLAILFFCLAVLGHKSIIPLFFLLPFAKIRLHTKLYPYLLFLLPLVGIVVESLFINYLIDKNLISEEYYKNYLDVEAPFLDSIGNWVEFVVHTIPYSLFVLYFIIELIRKKRMKNHLYEHLRVVTFFFVVCLIVALFVFGFTNPMFYRYYEVLKYPLLLLLPIVLPHLYQLRFTYRNVLFLFVFIGGQLYRIMLMAFYEYLG